MDNPQPAQQPHLVPPEKDDNWRNARNYENERLEMRKEIVQRLIQRKPNAPASWMKKVPEMAKRLEEALFKSARSFDDYDDRLTLKRRLQTIAVSVAMRVKRMQQDRQYGPASLYTATPSNTNQPSNPEEAEQRQEQQQQQHQADEEEEGIADLALNDDE